MERPTAEAGKSRIIHNSQAISFKNATTLEDRLSPKITEKTSGICERACYINLRVLVFSIRMIDRGVNKPIRYLKFATYM